jgi:hypothetical protein
MSARPPLLTSVGVLTVAMDALWRRRRTAR